MPTLGSLFVSIRASVDDFVGDMKGIQKELDETQKYVKPLVEQISRIGETMSIVGDVVVGGLFEITNKTAELGTELEHLHQKTGIAAQDLSVFRVAASQSGVSIDDLQAGLKKFSTAVVAAADGSAKQAKAFNDIGVSVRDANGQIRPMGDLFIDVANRTSQMSDGIQKAADTTVILGKNGQALIPMLNQLGTEGFDSVYQKAKAFGVLLSDEAAKDSEDFHRSLDALKLSTEGLGMTIGEQLMPLFTEITQEVTAVVQGFRQWADAHADVTKGVLAAAAAIGGTGGLLLAVSGVVAIWPALVAGFTVLTGPIGIAVLAVTAFTAALIEFPKFRGTVVDVLKNVVDALALVGSWVASVGEAAMQLASGQFKNAWETMTHSVANAMDTMQSADDGFNTLSRNISNATVTVKALTKEQQEAEAQAEASKKAIDSLVQSIEGQKNSQLALAPAIQKALADGISMNAIIDQEGAAVDKYVQQLQSEGKAIPAVLQQVEAANAKRSAELALRNQILEIQTRMGNALDVEAAKYQNVAGAISAMNSIQKQANDQLQMWIDDGAQLTEAQQGAVMASNDLDNQLVTILPDLLDNVDAWEKLTAGTDSLTTSQQKALQVVRDMNTAEQNAKDFHDESAASITKEALAAYKASEDLKVATQEVKNSAGKVFDDMFIKGQSVFSSLQNMLKGGALSLGRTIFEDITGALLGPIQKAFNDFFTGLISGPNSPLTKLGSSIGDAISKALGGIGSGPDLGGFVPAGGTQGTGGMSGLLKGGLITAGIGAAIAAGEALWNHFTQLGKDKSTFVSQYQNPFGNNLVDIVNQFNAARASGQLTVSDATTTLNSVKTLIANFESNISDWTKKGGDYATVAQRAQATMDADFGANFSDLLASMQTNIDQRQGVIDDAVTAQTAATDAQNAQNQATSDATAATTSATDSMNTFTSSVIKWGDQLGQITKAADQAQKMTAASGHPTTGAISSAVTTAQAAADVANTATKAVTTTVNGILTASGVYMSANQLADLANSGGSYTASSGYGSLIPGAGLSSVTGTYFSPGSIANMTQDQLAALGIPSYGSGTPMVKQRHLAVLDPGEAVLTAQQNRGGKGGNTYNIYSYSMDPDGAARSIRTVIDTIEANPGGQKDRLKRVLGVR